VSTRPVFRLINDGVEFRVKLVPGSAGNKIVGPLADAIKVAVSAPPEKGKANRALTELLADALQTSRSAVTIVAGLTGQRKTVHVSGVSCRQCEDVLIGVV